MNSGAGQQVIAIRSEGPPPARRDRSLRRTASWSSDWPDGLVGDIRTIAQARDLFTPDADAVPEVLSSDTIELGLAPDRTVRTIDASRCRDALQAIVGMLPGGAVRRWMAEALPSETKTASALHLLLDDLAGASLVSGGAWMAWTSDWRARYREALGDIVNFDRDVTDICIGFRESGSTRNSDGTPDFDIQHNVVMPPAPGNDPWAVHDWPSQQGQPGHRRTRRIDLWMEDGVLVADIGFQDSNALPGTDHRRIIHEYRAYARIDPRQLTLLALEIVPAVLPYGECLAGAVGAQKLVGRPVDDFRQDVPATLRGPLGCTHLNDVLRGLADIGPMADLRRAALRRGCDVGTWPAGHPLANGHA